MKEQIAGPIEETEQFSDEDTQESQFSSESEETPEHSDEAKAGQKSSETIKIFDLYDSVGIEIQDPGLKRVINFQPRLVLKGHGRIKGKFAPTKINIVERLIRELSHPGHRGKKHKVMTKATGKFNKQVNTVLKAFKIIKEKTGENPVKILIKAIEKGSPREEVTTIEYGGAKYPQAVDTSPIRRVSLTLRLLVHGAQDKAFGKKTKIYEALANEIVLAAQESGDSFIISKKVEAEKQANSAR